MGSSLKDEFCETAKATGKLARISDALDAPVLSLFSGIRSSAVFVIISGDRIDSAQKCPANTTGPTMVDADFCEVNGFATRFLTDRACRRRLPFPRPSQRRLLPAINPHAVGRLMKQMCAIRGTTCRTGRGDSERRSPDDLLEALWF